VLQAPDVALKMSTTLEVVPTAQGMRLARAISKPTSAHSTIRYLNPHNTTRKDTEINMATRTNATSEDRDPEIRQRCGCKNCSSCAENCSAPVSRRHVEDVHNVGPDIVAHCARHETCTRNQQTNLRPLNHKITQSTKPTRKDTEINMATRTIATSEDRDSMIRQRCGCKKPSSYAKSCSAPSSRRRVEDVHSGGEAAAHCARHETCTRNQQTNLRPLNHPIPQPAQHNTQRYGNKHGNTYNRHQRRSRFHDSAAMWLQEHIELR
jgi:hypothetical protein